MGGFMIRGAWDSFGRRWKGFGVKDAELELVGPRVSKMGPIIALT